MPCLSFIKRMTLKTRLFGQIACSIVLLAATNACSEDNTLGIDLFGKNTEITYVDTLTLLTSTVKEDSLQTGYDPVTGLYPSRSYLGVNVSNIYGTSTAGFYTQLRLPENEVNFGDPSTLRLDSAVLIFAYNDRFAYGDTITPFGLKVFELNQSIYKDSTYYSNQNLSIKPNPILNIPNYRPRPLTAYKIYEPKGDNTFDTIKVQRQMRLRLNDDFGRQLLLTSPSNLRNNEVFISFFKGIYVTATPASTQHNSGAMLDLSLNVISNLTLYYSKSDTAKKYVLPISNTCVRINHFEHNYTANNAKVAQNLNKINPQNGELYITGLIGTKIKVQMPYLRNLKLNDNIAINKAELVFNLIDESQSFYPVPGADRVSTGLVLYKIDSLQKNTFASFFGGSNQLLSAELRPRKVQYKMNITNYLQQVLYDNKPDYGLFVSIASAKANPNRCTLGSAATATNELKPKLLLTYTKVKQ